MTGCSSDTTETPDKPDAATTSESPTESADSGDTAEAAAGLVCEGVWARQGRGAAKTGAVFLTITNNGQEDDKLVQADSTVAEAVELHESYRDGEVMRMKRVDSMDIPAGGKLELKPGSYHIMLIGVLEELPPARPSRWT